MACCIWERRRPIVGHRRWRVLHARGRNPAAVVGSGVSHMDVDRRLAWLDQHAHHFGTGVFCHRDPIVLFDADEGKRSDASNI